MIEEPYYLWRYVRGKEPELVAVVYDQAMAGDWVFNRPPKEWRRAMKNTYGAFSLTV